MKITRSQLKQLIKETAAEYVWGVKKPGRVANQYSISTLRLDRLICEEIDRLLEATTPAGVAVHYPDSAPAGGSGIAAAGVAEQTTLEQKKSQWSDTIDEIVKFADEKLKADAAQTIDPGLIGFLIDDFNKLMEQILASVQQKYATDQTQFSAGQ